MGDIYRYGWLKIIYWWNEDYRFIFNIVKWKDKKLIRIFIGVFFNEIKVLSEKF